MHNILPNKLKERHVLHMYFFIGCKAFNNIFSMLNSLDSNISILHLVFCVVDVVNDDHEILTFFNVEKIC